MMEVGRSAEGEVEKRGLLLMFYDGNVNSRRERE